MPVGGRTVSVRKSVVTFVPTDTPKVTRRAPAEGATARKSTRGIAERRWRGGLVWNADLITTNRAFKDWNVVFPNATSIATLLDRLTHHADISIIDGQSYRVRESEQESAARRLIRPADRPQLPQIRSLHYFLPVIDEVRLSPLPSSYLHYLESKIRSVTLPGAR